MSAGEKLANIGYFGKIPSRGDFIKATDNVPLVSILDEWLAQAMDLLSAEPRWKIAYDAVSPLHFAFIGPRSRRAIAGHLIASNDQANRRFPFLAVSTMEIDEPQDFTAKSPMAFARLWNRLEAQASEVVAATDPALSLQNLTATGIPLQLGSGAYHAAFTDFMEIQTIGGLENMLRNAGFKGSLRHLILALGILLQPVMASSSSRLEKSLVMPLPDDPMYRNLVASYWLHLITPFLLRGNFELATFVTRINDQPSMVIGFSGASPRTLQALMDPQVALDHHISFEDASWVEDQVKSDYSITKIASYLAQPTLSLKSAHDSFRDVFIGA
ncbi:type VI secretion system-associated protein TagF [Collimonas sp.]|jgi:type VI secretion system protein ImpM|uniref:type VI secretion system-associated protein TagF n=1 Tax=Collimonas sp. TaxID=1963772 RepID=UPI002C08D66A|nr:type VI secretion system-associated protein TagF [Collimonas sp.]HWW08148.1 type VI secretion system-associated protein TagF [Collimonas sp.]